MKRSVRSERFNARWIPWDKFADKNCPHMKSIRAKWAGLLRKEKLHERYYHDFVARHAHIFFPMFLKNIQVVSKIRLGAELVTDLVLVRDEPAADSLIGLSKSNHRGPCPSRKTALHLPG